MATQHRRRQQQRRAATATFRTRGRLAALLSVYLLGSLHACAPGNIATRASPPACGRWRFSPLSCAHLLYRFNLHISPQASCSMRLPAACTLPRFTPYQRLSGRIIVFYHLLRMVVHGGRSGAYPCRARRLCRAICLPSHRFLPLVSHAIFFALLNTCHMTEPYIRPADVYPCLQRHAITTYTRAGWCAVADWTG